MRQLSRCEVRGETNQSLLLAAQQNNCFTIHWCMEHITSLSSRIRRCSTAAVRAESSLLSLACDQVHLSMWSYF